MLVKALRVYTLGTKDKKVVNKTFNKLYEQDQMSWTTTATLFSYLVFVV